MDSPSPDFNVDGRQWRSSVVFIFAQYFRAIWLDPQVRYLTGYPVLSDARPSF